MREKQKVQIRMLPPQGRLGSRRTHYRSAAASRSGSRVTSRRPPMRGSDASVLPQQALFWAGGGAETPSLTRQDLPYPGPYYGNQRQICGLPHHGAGRL